MLNFAVSCRLWHRALLLNALAAVLVTGQSAFVNAQPRSPEQTPDPALNPTVDCELLIVGAGFAGTAAAYEGLLAGRTVCLTDITDWVGGQVSSQGTSALDEAKRMREQRFFPRGYNEFRDRIVKKYGSLSPGNCWVSVSCFLPSDGHQILSAMQHHW